MGPDAAMAGAALADMARRWASSNPGFGQNVENAPQLPLLIDLLENENQYLLTADVPGLQKSDLKVCIAQTHCPCFPFLARLQPSQAELLLQLLRTFSHCF